MDPRRTIIGILVLTLLIALSAPTLAGGSAIVRLDEPPGDVPVAKPWRFGFMVLQHDISPNSDVTPVLRAVHKETGEAITATGQQEGAVGHFVIEVTFPQAGEWKWSIEPRPYAETSFETLIVRESPSASAYPASIQTGSCAAPGDIAFPLGDIEPQTMVGKSTQVPVAVSSSTIDASLPTLIETGYAIDIGLVACGDIAGAASDDGDELVLGLQGETPTENVGVAVLRSAGGRTDVTLYLVNPTLDRTAQVEAAPVAGEAKTVEILDPFAFAPYSVEIAPGDTVTWINASQTAHTVTGDDLAFDDSGPIDPGESFSITFDEPGTYEYRCGPHPDMVGQIVVS